MGCCISSSYHLGVTSCLLQDRLYVGRLSIQQESLVAELSEVGPVLNADEMLVLISQSL